MSEPPAEPGDVVRDPDDDPQAHIGEPWPDPDVREDWVEAIVDEGGG